MLLNYTFDNITSYDIIALNQFNYEKVFCAFEWTKYMQLFLIFLIWLSIIIIYFYEKKKTEKSQKMIKIKGIKGIVKVKTPLRTHIWGRFQKR